MKTRGLTLVEMVVVVAILGVLASLIIPRLESTITKSQSSVSASDMESVARSILVYKSSNVDGNFHYPANWDSLLDGTSAIWTPGAGTTPGLEPALYDQLALHTISSAAEVTLIKNTFEPGNHLLPDDRDHVFVRDLGSSANVAPSDMFNFPREIALNGKLASIKTSSAIWLSAFPSVTDTELTQAQNNGDLLAFGVGPNNDMSANSKKSTVYAVPQYPGIDAGLYYERYIAIFYLNRVNATIELKTVVGADGKTTQQVQADYRSGSN